MNKRSTPSKLLAVVGILFVSGYALAYGVDLSFPAARRFPITQGA